LMVFEAHCPAASFNALLSASPSPRHDVLVVGKMMAGDWGWRKERYPLNVILCTTC
jgi:hypothetical protein